MILAMLIEKTWYSFKTNLGNVEYGLHLQGVSKKKGGGGGDYGKKKVIIVELRNSHVQMLLHVQ